MKMNNISDDVHKVTKTNTQTIHYIQNHWSDIVIEGLKKTRMSVSFPQDTHRYDIFNHKYSLNTKTKMEYSKSTSKPIRIT